MGFRQGYGSVLEAAASQAVEGAIQTWRDEAPPAGRKSDLFPYVLRGVYHFIERTPEQLSQHTQTELARAFLLELEGRDVITSAQLRYELSAVRRFLKELYDLELHADGNRVAPEETKTPRRDTTRPNLVSVAMQRSATYLRDPSRLLYRSTNGTRTARDGQP